VPMTVLDYSANESQNSNENESVNGDLRKLIGACGNCCSKCNDYLAYVTKDRELRKKVAFEIKEQGIEVSPDQVGCQGCWGNIHNAWSASLDCKIRQCAAGKSILTCAECDDFPCNIYRNQFDIRSSQAENINRIRQIGVESWFVEMDGLSGRE
jgi:hypothetical protein